MTADSHSGDEADPVTDRLNDETEDDASQSTPTTTTPTQSQDGKLYQRPNSVIIRLPGIDDPSQRPTDGSATSLAGVIDAILDRRNISEIEVLAFPGESALVYVLTVDVTATDRERLDRGGQTTIEEFTERDSTTPASKLDILAEELAATLDDAIGIEIGHVDLSPINTIPVIGTRMLLESNRSVSNTDYVEHLHDGLIQRLADTTKPFLLQTIVSQQSEHNYLLTMRYAVLDPDHMLGPTTDKAQHLDNGRELDLSGHIKNCGVKTNHDLPISDFARPRLGEVKLKERKYKELSHSQTALDLYCGTPEFRDLLRGRPGADQLYEELDLHGRIPLPQTELKHAATVRLRYYFEGPWESVPHQYPPRISTTEIYRQAVGTKHSLGIQFDATPDSAMTASSGQQESDSEPVTAGSKQHEALVSFVVRYCETLGYDARAHEQESGESVPDIIVVRDGQRYHYEVEIESRSSPGNILVNYGRAVDNDVPVVFVRQDISKAEFIPDLLLQPHKGTDDDQTAIRDGAVNLYTISGDGVTLADTVQPLLPKEESESRWWLAGRTLKLRTEEGRILAEGPADASFDDFDWYTPRYEKSGGDHRVVDSDGNLIEEAATKKAVLTNWTKVHEPFVPTDLHCLSDAEVMYPSGDELAALSLTADWGTATDGKMAVYEKGMDKFIDQFIVEEAGASIPYDEFQDQVEAFFECRAEEVPTATYIGRALPERITVDSKHDTDRHVNNVRWVYEPGMCPPWHPYADSDDTDADDVTPETTGEGDDDGVDTADADTSESGDTDETDHDAES